MNHKIKGITNYLCTLKSSILHPSLSDSFNEIRVRNQNDIFDFIPFGHPYRPMTPAILFVLKGTVVLKEQINTHTLYENWMMIIDTSSVYEVLEVSEDLEIRLLAYSRTYLDQIAIQLNKIKVYDNLKKQLKRKFLLDAYEMTRLIRNIDALVLYIQSESKMTYYLEIIHHHFIVILYHLASIVEKGNDEEFDKLTRNQKILYEFVQLVASHYLETKSVEFYANKLQMTSRYLSRVIKEESGNTPNEIITQYILNEAKAQLSSTLNPIKSIASELHFSDQYSFAHFFKKHEQMSPSEYRKQFLT